MKTHIIGLTGFAGSGKDTVADMLVTHLGFRKLAFADALRAEVSEGFQVDPIYLSRPETKHHAITALAMKRAPQDFLAAVAMTIGKDGRDQLGHLSPAWLTAPRSPRQILQWWGTEYRRKRDARHWTRIVLDRVATMHRNGVARFVVTDVRFENEADTVHGAGGLLWQITRPGCNGAQEGNHVSATDGSVFKPAAVLANTHDLRHLQQLVLSEFTALDSGIAGVKVTVPL